MDSPLTGGFVANPDIPRYFMNADWFPDPSGRFAQRFFDGTAWTEHVVAANGTTVADPLVASHPPPPPPPPSVPASFPPSAPPHAPVHAGSAARGTGPRTSSWVGVSMSGAGLLLAILSLYALDWADGTTAGDLRDDLPGSLPDGLPLADVVSFTYVRWGGLLLLFGAAVALVAVVIGVSRRDGDATRIVGAAVAGIAATLHTVTVVRLFRGPGIDPALGAWLGTIGFLAVAFGFAIAAPRHRTAP